MADEKKEKTVKEKSSKEIKEEILSLQSSTKPVETPEEIEAKQQAEDKKSEVQSKEVSGKKQEEKGKAKAEEKKGKEEELILGKFKTLDDIKKSYQEAEKKISHTSEESSRAKKDLAVARQLLSQFYDFDENGNIVAAKRELTQPQYQSQQADPLAQVRPYFPGVGDEQIMGFIGLSSMITNTALNKFKKQQEESLQPLMGMKFERDVEVQKKEVKAKYDDYAEFESEVNEKLATLPPELRAKEGAVETIFFTIRGERVPDIRKQVEERIRKEVQSIERKKEDTFVEGGGTTSVPTPPVNIGEMSSKDLKSYINKITKK